MSDLATAVGSNWPPVIVNYRLWWEPRPDMTFAEWYEEGEKLLKDRDQAIDATQFQIGDLLVFGESMSGVFGEERSQLIGTRHRDTARKWMQVARAYPKDQRREGVSWTIHERLATLEPELRAELLDLAFRNDWGKEEVLAEKARRLNLPSAPPERAPAHNGHAAEPEVIPPPQAGLVKKHEAGPTATKIIEAEPEPPGTRLHLNLPPVVRPPYDSTLPPKSFGRPSDDSASRLHSIAKTTGSQSLREDIYTVLREREELLEQLAA